MVQFSRVYRVKKIIRKTYVIILLMSYSSPNYPPQKTHFYCFTNRVLFCTPNCIGIIVFQLFEQTHRVGQLK